MSKVHSRTYDFGPRFSELVLHEIDPRYSREEVTLAASSGDLEFGTVLTRMRTATTPPSRRPTAPWAMPRPC